MIDYKSQKTEKKSTVTAAGIIPHLYHPSGLLLPVKLAVSTASENDLTTLPLPMRNSDGCLLYALPGGGTYVGGR